MKSIKIAILAVAILWGTSFAFQRGLLESVDPVVFTLYNFLVTGIGFLLYALYKKQNIFSRLREGIVLGIFLTLMEVTQMFGLHLSSAANASFISNMGMLFVPYLGWLIYKHKVQVHDSLLLLLTGIGMYLLVGGTSGFGLGDLVLVLSAIGMALYFLFSERYEGERGSHMATLCAQQFILVGVLCFLITSITKAPLAIPEAVLFDFGWQILAFTALPYALIQWASRRSDEMLVAMYDGVVEPLVGGLVAWGLFLEATSTNKVVGGLIMVFAFGVSIIYNKRHVLFKRWELR